MAKFAYNNTKNTSTGYMLFELNCSYYPHVCFEDEFDPCSRTYLTNKLAKEFRILISIYQQNLLHTEELQKQANDKDVKICSYASDEKVWFNGK